MTRVEQNGIRVKEREMFNVEVGRNYFSTNEIIEISVSFVDMLS